MKDWTFLDFFLRAMNDIVSVIFYKRRLSKIRLLAEFMKVIIKYVFIYKLLGRKITTERIFGHLVHLYSYESFIRLFGEIFVEDSYAFESNLKNPRIIDCGSNIGMSVLYFKILYPNARIIAFEPDAKLFALLKKNVESNAMKDIELVNAAIYCKDGTIDLFAPLKIGSLEKIDMAMTAIRGLAESYDTRVVKQSVPTVRLSKYIKDPIDFLKIDIEGTEGVVVPEISGRLLKVKEMVIEYHFSGGDENDLAGIVNALKKNGFEFMIVGGVHWRPLNMLKDTNANSLIYAYRR